MQNFHQFSRPEDTQQLIDAIGGECLDGSGFENEEPEIATGEAEG